MTDPLIGRSAVILHDSTVIGYVQGISAHVEADTIKDYSMDANTPAALGYGKFTITFDIDKMYIDKTYAELLLNRTASLDIEIRPEGTGSGKQKVTISDVVFTTWDMTIEQDGVILEKVAGEGKNIAFESQT